MPQTHPFLSYLDACTSFSQLKRIQSQMVTSGLISDPFAAGRLIAVSALSIPRNLPHALAILRGLECPNTFSWNVAIRACSDGDGNTVDCFLLYKQLLLCGARPDNFTYPFLFKACSNVSWRRFGHGAFGHVLHLGLESDVFVFNTLIHMFAFCKELVNARKLFDESPVRDLVSWNTMINAYVQGEKPRKVLGLFQEMVAGCVRPDVVTMIGVVLSCTKMQDLELGMRFHAYIEENKIGLTAPLTNALMDMYIKCGSLERARALFDRMRDKTLISWTTMIAGYAKFGLLDAAQNFFDQMPVKDVVPWNALISGYVQCEQGKKAMDLFHKMQAYHVVPDQVTMVSLLSACGQLGALDMGVWLHHYIEKREFRCSVALGTALVDMYAKCGNIEKSIQVFKEIPERNALTWTAIICGLASHGHALAAIGVFSEMLNIGLEPDGVTFLGVLSACCHAGLVNEGRMYFEQMCFQYKIKPKVKHYSCMVDLLGRAGFLSEAEELIEKMPMVADPGVWGALFFACRTHGNIAMGEHAALKLLELDPHDSGIYVLLANMYAEAGMRERSDKAWMSMRKMKVEKTPGCSLIELNGVVFEFIVRDKSHAEHKEIKSCLMLLTGQMTNRGCSFIDVHINLE